MIENTPGSLLPFTGLNTMEELSLLTTALNSTTAGITITDNTQPDNPIIFCNDSFEMITGYKRQEIIGRNCRFLQGTDRAQPELDKLREHINSGKACRVELRNYKKDGHLFYNELYLSPVKDAKGNIRFFIGIQNDVTARKNAEETLVNEREAMAREVAETTQRLRENEQYLASIIETVRESLIVLSPDLIVLSVNHHFLRVFQVTLEETKGRSLFELGNGQWNSEQLRVLLDQVLPTSNPVLDFEVEHDFPTIGKKLMLLNAYRVELEGKYKDRILLAIEDITERRAMEMRKDDFLSIASHELKTPLTTIKGYIQVASTLVKADTNPRLVNILAKTEKSAERLNNLISELLDMARIQSGSVKLLMEEYDFDLLVRETIFEFGDTVPDRIIKLEGSTDVKLLLDEGHLVQVIVNLLSNAIKYSDNSSEVNVYIGRVGDYVKLSVTDKGVGISEDEKKHVFDRFFRSQHIQMKYPGMGIGLYICDQIIKNHNGSLWVESTHGEGSTFSFTIPVNQSL